MPHKRPGPLDHRPAAITVPTIRTHPLNLTRGVTQDQEAPGTAGLNTHHQQSRRELLRLIETLQVLPHGVRQGVERDRLRTDSLGPHTFLARWAGTNSTSSGKRQFKISLTHQTNIAPNLSLSVL